jgi:flagellar basal-body rod protein FlgG
MAYIEIKNGSLNGIVRTAVSQEIRFGIIANNLANAQTPGFKRDGLSFEETLKEVVRPDFTPGNMQHTGNTFDLALDGNAFFRVQTPNGIRYTKNGSFGLNTERVLVTQNGDPILGKNGPITIEEEGEVVIDANGEIFVGGNSVDSFSVVNFGTVESDSSWVFGGEIKAFEDLKKEGLSYYRYEGDEEQISESEDIVVMQGFLEQSNVSVVEEMTKMIETQRMYESCQKMMQTFIEADSKATTEIGKVSG